MARHSSTYAPSSFRFPLVAILVLSWTVNRNLAISNAFLVNDTPPEAGYLDGEQPLSSGSESSNGGEHISQYQSKSHLLEGPAEVKRSARGSFRSDLGKRSGMPAEFYNSEEDDEYLDDLDYLDPADEISKRRYSGFRSDLGKRYSKFRNDLGKRRSGARLSNYRTDLGKRAVQTSTDSKVRGPTDHRDEETAASNVKNQSEEEVTWKRATFRSDLGKRLRLDTARRVFRSDLGKRRMFRNDLG